MSEFIEEKLGGGAVEVLVSFWSTHENILEEIGEEHGTGGIPEGGAAHAPREAYGKGGSRDG